MDFDDSKINIINSPIETQSNSRFYKAKEERKKNMWEDLDLKKYINPNYTNKFKTILNYNKN